MSHSEPQELIRFGSRRFEVFQAPGISSWSEFELVFDLGMVSISRADFLAQELRGWLLKTPHALEALPKFRTDDNERFYRVNDYLYELARKHPSALSEEAKRACVNSAYLHKTILDFGYGDGEVETTHRHQVNVLRIDKDGFLGCKSDRLRSYKFDKLLWLSSGYSPEVVTEEWAIAAKFTPSKKTTRVQLELVEIKAHGRLQRLPSSETSLEAEKSKRSSSLRRLLPRLFR